MGGGRDVPRSHAEVVAALSGYAAGVLGGRAEDVVRRHLAGGCRDCLDALFSRPVGLGRRLAAERRPMRGTLSIVTAVLSVIALMGTVLASTIWLTGGAWSPPDHRLSRGRLSALEAQAADAQVRLESLGSRSTALEAHLGPLSHEWGPAPRSDPADAGRRAETAATQQALVQLGAALSGPGTRVAPLRPAVAGRSARGWVIRDPLRGRLFVYAVGLPRLVAPWNARITFGGNVRRVPLRRMVDGSLWGMLDRLDASTCAAHVTIVPPGADRIVLAGNLACRAGPRA